ncbi:polyadenylate-binding protein-interacting protein 4-like [Ananas comosus]|uniref:Polyadenylate-binding protein-interacting protein 4-like n=1 Tax=Ananas comosus TaxID=4615 RepID=A0A6P5GV33_ANACO|nr:polyadenylate-binding protein-interacting protein 4-like [Ananas comosus]
MNLQQAGPPRTSVNGFGRRTVETGGRVESKTHPTKAASSSFGNAGLGNGGKAGGHTSPLRDRLIFVTTHLIGQRVEVHVKNGSVISGIFYATNADKDFGVVLKMAHLIKDGSVRGQKPSPDFVKKPETLIIPAREFVQVVAKDVVFSTDEFTNQHGRDKRKDFMIDSVISHSHHMQERELERWTPDEDAPERPELENIFDGTWNRNWDQFETNAALFGVKSTFDEELYTTKLEKGPQTRQLEMEASRLAREIEGEETEDLHLAEERGVYFDGDFDLDEEIKYSAVRRDINNDRFQENEESHMSDSSLGSAVTGSYLDSFSAKVNNEGQESSTCTSVDEEPSSQLPSDKDTSHIDTPVQSNQLPTECIAMKSLSVDEESRLLEKQVKDDGGEKHVANVHMQFSEGRDPSVSEVVLGSDSKGLPSSAAAHFPSSSSHGNSTVASENSNPAVSGKLPPAAEPVNTIRPSSSTSSTSERGGSVGTTGLSPSSSMGSLSSERSTLNPNAKEFKLNPNAKSFTPSPSLRPHAPVPDGSFYYASNFSAVQPMPSLPVGMGIGPPFGGQQPVVYNPQAAQLQSPQAYIQPSGPMYGQQMILGQPRPVYYVPNYMPETPYRGRNF